MQVDKIADCSFQKAIKLILPIRSQKFRKREKLEDENIRKNFAYALEENL
jgi:hypothetical protein